MIGWFLKHRYTILPVTIIVFVFFLFMAIYNRIDGLGVFSIAASIIFFFLLMYARPKYRDPGSGSGSGRGYSPIEENIQKNASYILNEILQPKYIPLIITIFTNIVAFLEKNQEKLTKEQIDDITLKINNFDRALKHEEPKLFPKPPKPTR